MTRVLLTTDAVGGVWTYALDLAAGLSRRRFEVVLAVLGPPPRTGQRRAAEAIPGLRLVETGLALDWTARDASELRGAATALQRLAGDLAVDLVHLNSPALAAGGGFAAPVLGACHSCLASWWATVRDGPPPGDFAWRIEATAEGYAACQALVAPSRAFADLTAQFYGVCPTVVWNGRAAPPPPPNRPRAGAIAAGRLWDEGKGMAVLDAAASFATHPIQAAGPLEGPLGQRAAFRHLQALGPLGPAALAARFASARVFVSAARYEPFGLTALEAAQAGCALVLSDIPTHRELWDGAALFAAPEDAKGFASALDRLLVRPELSDALADAARARAARYTAERMVDGVVGAYRRILPARAAA